MANTTKEPGATKAPAKGASKEAKAGKSKASAERVVAPAGPVPDKVTPRLHTLYMQEIREALKKEFNYKNPMQVPVLEKIVINMGLGDGVNDGKVVTTSAQELSLIAGQKAVITKAKKSIATFKLREHLPIGCKVTLRKQRMYEFLDRLVTVALPRVRDFRGVSGKSFDGKGNYTLGLKEQIVFPEINYDKVDKVRGMDITFVTTARTDAEAKALLRAFKLPFIN